VIFVLWDYVMMKTVKKSVPGRQPIELTQIQWFCPVCNNCKNSPQTTQKFRTGPNVGHCIWSQFFFLEVITWFNKENVTSFSLCPTKLIFCMKIDTSRKKPNIIRNLNFTFIYARYCLYNKKLIHGELSVNEFIDKHKYIFKQFLD